MAPVTRRALAARSLSGAGLGIDTDNDMRNGTTQGTREEGNGPGSCTGGRAQKPELVLAQSVLTVRLANIGTGSPGE